MSLDDAKNQLKNAFEDEAEDYIKAFSEVYPENTPQDPVSFDWLFRPKTIICADAIDGMSMPDTYMYMFIWKSQ